MEMEKGRGRDEIADKNMDTLQPNEQLVQNQQEEEKI